MKVPGLIVIVIVALLATPVNSQQQGSISGVVRDRTGARLPGVWVTAAGPAALERRMAVSDAEGRYTLAGLPQGRYVVQFHLPGFTDVTTSNVGVTSAVSTPLDVEMRVGPLQETFGRSGPSLLLRPPQAPRDPRIECLHGPNETEPESQRRLEAFNAMHLIYSVLEQVPTYPTGRGYPDWQTLARTSAVAALKKTPGPVGELASRMQWGSAEPLPGWRIRYSAGISVEYALTDITDSCGFTLSSNDPKVISPRARTMPLT
jgi:hypothetical protein